LTPVDQHAPSKRVGLGSAADAEQPALKRLVREAFELVKIVKT
jgi:hypothetical protein